MRPVPDYRVAQGAPVTLSRQYVDADGEPAAPAGTVTVGVTDATGATVVAAATATSGATTAPRTYTLAATATTALALLTATWTDSGAGATTQLVEVVGGFHWSLAQFRTRFGESFVAGLGNAAVIGARRIAEETCEEITGVAWVPRYRRERLSGSGTEALVLPDPMLRSVRSVRLYSDATTYTAETVSVSLGGLDARSGVAVRTDGGVWPVGCDNIVIEYEHGFDRPPQDVADACMFHARSMLTAPNAPMADSAERYTTPDGVVIFRSLPAANRTGLLQVDAVYERHSFRVPGLA